MKNIALIGFMGSGKTTVGRILAKRLGYSFADMDEVIERKSGKAIANIFRDDGEEAFRNAETETLLEVLAKAEVVISCGGGVILREENRSALRLNSIVVFLKAGPEEIFKRVGNTGDMRPLLNTDNPRAAIERMLQDRESYYESAADIGVDTTGKSPGRVAELIIEELTTIDIA